MKAAILLVDPKYPHNVGAVIRSCSCYGVEDLLYSGKRMDEEVDVMGRLPREERMRGYKEVKWRKELKPFDVMKGFTPVAIEVLPSSVSLHSFVHPENALYVFGPEDGSLHGVTLRHCHHFVSIPTRHCLNLATAVSTVLYDRQHKMNPDAQLTVGDTEERIYV